MLRKIRITAAAVFFTVITLLLLDFTGTLHAWFGWMAKVQLLPAVLAVNAGVVAALVLLTLLFGRVYCSVICPLGVFQDVVSRAAARRRKNRFRYSLALSWLRYGILVLFLVALAAHFKPVSNLLAPYSAYGRIVSNLFAPLYLWGNNLLAYLAERAGSYAFYTVDVWVKGAATLAVTAVTFIVLAVLAWRNGRTYCNTVCPVGTILGLVSRFAVFKPRIDASKCNGCGLCARNCKASCIDAKAHRIDYSRCVACMDCLGKCPPGSDLLFAQTRCRPQTRCRGTCDREGGRCGGGTGRCFAPQVPFAGRGHGLCDGQGAGEEGRRRPGRDRAEENPPAYDAHYPARIALHA